MQDSAAAASSGDLERTSSLLTTFRPTSSGAASSSGRRSASTLKHAAADEEKSSAARPSKKQKLLDSANAPEEFALPASVSPATRSEPSDGLDLLGDDDDFFFSLLGDTGNAKTTFFRALDDRRNEPEEESGAAAAAAAAASTPAALEAQEDARLAALVFNFPPLDWNVHSKIRFTSSTPFSWIAPNIEAETDGMQAFLTATGSDHCKCMESSALREFHHALCYAQFPASPFTRAHPLTSSFQLAMSKVGEQLTHADKLAVEYVQRMWVQWEDSFRALYSRIRLPPTSPSSLDHFYSLHRSPFAYSVLFVAADAEEETQPSALLSRSNRSFRAMLQKHGIAFTLPNSNRADKTCADAQPAPPSSSVMDDSDAAIQARLLQRKEEKLERDEDLTPASVVLVQGKKDLHALYDFLLNQDRRELYMPTLLASSVFLNSTPQALNIVRIGATTKRTADTATSAPAAAAASSKSAPPMPARVQDPLYTLDITGPILPASVVRLLSVLQHTQKGSFQGFFSSDASCHSLNCTSEVLQMDSLRNQESIALCQQACLRSSHAIQLAGKLPIHTIGALKRVRLADNHFRVELSS